MPIPLRIDFDASAMRSFARKTKDGPQARRLLALAAIYDGATRTEAAKIGDVTPQIVRDWVMKFNANGPDGLIDRKSPGQPSRLNDAQRAAIAGDGRQRADPSHPWRGSLARRRSLPMGFRGVSGHCGQADPEP
jgi:transposase